MSADEGKAVTGDTGDVVQLATNAIRQVLLDSDATDSEHPADGHSDADQEMTEELPGPLVVQVEAEAAAGIDPIREEQSVDAPRDMDPEFRQAARDAVPRADEQQAERPRIRTQPVHAEAQLPTVASPAPVQPRGLKKNTVFLLMEQNWLSRPTLICTDSEGAALLCVENNNFDNFETIRIEEGQVLTVSENFEALEWDEVAQLVESPEYERKCEEMLDLKPTHQFPDKERNRMILAELAKNGMKKESKGLESLVLAFQDIFALSDNELGCAKGFDHQLDTGSAKPFRQRPRPVPLPMQEQVKELLQRMKDQGIVKKSNSPWASPCVLVRKKDGSIRLCVDFRKLNEVLRHDAHPLPHMDITIQSLHGFRYFSTFDLVSGFWQLPMHPNSQSKTAFAIMNELLEFKVMPYGLANAPASFQRMMQCVLEDILGQNIFVYIDDLVVATASWDEHIRMLKQVFTRLRKFGLRLKASKCSIGREEVRFLGHVVSKDGVSVDEEKIEKIKKCPRPASISELRTFLGMCSYYRKFVNGFSSIATPLYNLTSTTAKWSWGEPQVRAFDILKNALCTTPILAQPDVKAARKGTRPFVVYTDASKQGVGGVLCQEDTKGRMHPIYFMSKKLNPAQSRYHPTDLEAYAIKQALGKFRPYTYGTQILVRTDHQALVALLKRSNLSERTLRWALELQDENIVIEYVKGKANGVADALSRGPIVLGVGDDPEEEQRLDRIINEIVAEPDTETDEWQKALNADSGYQELKLKFEQGHLDEEVSIEKDTKLAVKDFVMVDEKLFYIGEDGFLKRWTPQKFRQEVWRTAHDSEIGGHSNFEVSLKKISRDVYWPTMRKDFQQWYRQCVKCLVGNVKPAYVPPLHPRVTSGAFDTIGIDLIDFGQPTTRGNRYLLTAIDYFTKFAYAEALPSKNANVVSAALVNHLLRECRIPREIMSDQGGEFMNSVLNLACEHLKIERSYTKGYSKRENGLVERFNRTIEQILKKIVAVETEWDNLVPFALFAYNSACHSSTGESPSFLNYGRDPKMPFQGMSRNYVTINMQDVQDYKTELLAGLQIAHETVTENLSQTAEQMKKAFDGRRNTRVKPFCVGDRVILFEPAEKAKSGNPKVTLPFSGPYRVIKLNNTSATLKDLRDDSKECITVQQEQIRVVPTGMKDFSLNVQGGRQGKVVKPVTQAPVIVVPVRRSERLRNKVNSLILAHFSQEAPIFLDLDGPLPERISYLDVNNFYGFVCPSSSHKVYATTLRELSSYFAVARQNISFFEVLRAFNEPPTGVDIRDAMELLAGKGREDIIEVLGSIVRGKPVFGPQRSDVALIAQLKASTLDARPRQASARQLDSVDAALSRADSERLERNLRLDSDRRLLNTSRLILIGDSLINHIVEHYFRNSKCYMATSEADRGFESKVKHIIQTAAGMSMSCELCLVIIPYADPFLSNSKAYPSHVRMFERLKESLPPRTLLIVAPGILDAKTQERCQVAMRSFLSLLRDHPGILIRTNSAHETNGCDHAVKAIFRRGYLDFPGRYTFQPYVNFVLPPENEVIKRLRSDLTPKSTSRIPPVEEKSEDESPSHAPRAKKFRKRYGPPPRKH